MIKLHYYIILYLFTPVISPWKSHCDGLQRLDRIVLYCVAFHPSCCFIYKAPMSTLWISGRLISISAAYQAAAVITGSLSLVMPRCLVPIDPSGRSRSVIMWWNFKAVRYLTKKSERGD